MRTIIFSVLLLFGLLNGSCTPSSDFKRNLQPIVKPYLFSIAGWELEAIRHEVSLWFSARPDNINDEIRMVTNYFSAFGRVKALKSEIEALNAGNREEDLAALEAELNRLQEQRLALQDTVEKIIEKQIRDALTQQGIFNPVDIYINLRIGFPPTNIKLEEPPHLLVISPRDKIESIREIILQPNLSLEEKETIETRVDELGFSSLVVELAGLGTTYPTFVTSEASLRSTFNTAAEEWLHQYLAFKPLGFMYLLDLTGVSRNYEIATMNETLASMVSKEIGSIIYEQYYSQYQNSVRQNQAADAEDGEFDFDREMREIRKTVDVYLTRGEIEQAQEFMEQKRQYLASMGHYIRKLNQAYFAFHGTYADSPTSISPIGFELKKLRTQSASLKDFLETVASMASRQELRDSAQ